MLPPTPLAPLLVSRPAIATSVRELRSLAGRYAEAAGLAPAHDVVLAVSEAVTNVVVHAYPEGAGPIRLTAEVDGDALVVAVEDEGIGLRPRADSPGAGLGLPIMAEVAHQFRLDDGRARGVRVELRFDLAA